MPFFVCQVIKRKISRPQIAKRPEFVEGAYASKRKYFVCACYALYLSDVYILFT